VGDVLKIVGLDGLEDRPAPKLSGGQQQRVAFARALVNEPKVMLLDEPLSNLDAKLRVQMRSEIKALQRRTNITTIFVTHDQAEALAISDQIAVMHGGTLIEVGAPHQLYSRPTRRFTATFLGLTNLIDGKIVELHGDAQPGKIQTKKGLLSFIPAPGLKQDQAAVISIRPENIPLYKERPQGLENILEGKITEATIIGVVGLLLAVYLGGRVAESSIAPALTLSAHKVTLLMAAYGFMQGAWPLGLVAIVWAAGTFRRWQAAKTPAAQAMKPRRHLTNAPPALTKTESRFSRLFGPMYSNHDMQ